MKLGVKREVEVDAKILKVHLKVRDEFSASLEDTTGAEIFAYEGYVPTFMPGEHYGDYVILDIDIDTGQIKNWKPPTAEQLRTWMDKGAE